MKKLHLVWVMAAWLVALPVAAEQKLRVQVDQRGDFLMVGNTLGWDCGSGAATPVVGSPDNSFASFISCGLLSTDTSPDLFWRADEPADGQATASTTYTSADARTTAMLALPTGATVTHAFLYWGARRTGTTADTTATLERPGMFSMSVSAVASYVRQANADAIYESVADVTSLVSASGSGAYRVSGIDARSFPDAGEDVLFGGWALVVFYQLDSEPLRNLAIFDGLDSIDQLGATSTVKLSGFLVPNAGFDAKLGTIVYEGDNAISGDTLRFGLAPLDASDDLEDAENPSDNFFNGTRTLLGSPVSVTGDLPQLAGTKGTMAGIDLDVIDVTDRVMAGQKTVDLQALTFLDAYFMGAFVTSISTFKPDFTTSTKAVLDVDGGAAKVGDELEYTLTIENSGNDDSVQTVVTDELPDGVSFVADSIEVTGGGLGSYDMATHTVTVRAGTGATATMGGSIAAGASVTVVFRVTINSGAMGIISNQGSIEAAGKRGSPLEKTLTDGNGAGPGSPTTDTPVGECTSDTQCSATLPICDLDTGVCVGCTDNSQCPGGSMAQCDPVTMTCTCMAGGDCTDTDGDGLTDQEEIDAGTNPADRDTDDDGVSDGAEPSWDEDSDGDGLINALDPDSDDDALYDGTELGFGCDGAGTDATLAHCIPDGDMGATKTDPLSADSDGGGERDGSEDENLNGVLDAGERNPTVGNGADDNGGGDQDGDELSDGVEETLGSDPMDADTDDDGVPDGDERNPADDTDGDGQPNILDFDSDGDTLPDGLEAGRDCSAPGIDTARGQCIADADMGATKTSPVHPDSDRGGASDGEEDTNKNGVVDGDERDPNRACDDVSILNCGEVPMTDAGVPGGVDAGPLAPVGFAALGGGGCNCGVAGGNSTASGAWLWLVLAGVFGWRRSRRR